MIGYTPVELDIRRKAAEAGPPDPDDARYADADRVMAICRITPGIPFPHIWRERATLFFLAVTDPAEAEQAVQDAKVILGYALKVRFEPRQTVAHDVRHGILTAELPSGLFVDLVARAQHIGGQPAPQDAPELAEVAA